MVGLNSSDTDFDTAEETGGVKEVTLTAAQSGLPSHSHTQLGGGFDGSTGIEAGNQRTVDLGQTGTTGGTSAQQAHTNVQPYIVVYMWKRTA
jgi:microcystin-dependent protein